MEPGGVGVDGFDVAALHVVVPSTVPREVRALLLAMRKCDMEAVLALSHSESPLGHDIDKEFARRRDALSDRVVAQAAHVSSALTERLSVATDVQRLCEEVVDDLRSLLHVLKVCALVPLAAAAGWVFSRACMLASVRGSPLHRCL
jgi:hypothetical protein